MFQVFTLQPKPQPGDLVNFSIDSENFTVNVQGQTDSVTVNFSKDELEVKTQELGDVKVLYVKPKHHLERESTED